MSKISPAETARVLAQIDKATSGTAAAVERVLQTACPAYSCRWFCDCRGGMLADAVVPAWSRATPSWTWAVTTQVHSQPPTALPLRNGPVRGSAGRSWVGAN